MIQGARRYAVMIQTYYRLFQRLRGRNIGINLRGIITMDRAREIAPKGITRCKSSRPSK